MGTVMHLFTAFPILLNQHESIPVLHLFFALKHFAGQAEIPGRFVNIDAED
jgi:hypothetical protein